MSGPALFTLGCICGVLAGGVIPAYLEYRRAMREPPKIEIVIDQELARKIDERIVMGWLDARGLVWQPKGIEHILDGKTR